MVKQFESMCTAAVELTSIAVTGTLNRTGLICFEVSSVGIQP